MTVLSPNLPLVHYWPQYINFNDLRSSFLKLKILENVAHTMCVNFLIYAIGMIISCLVIGKPLSIFFLSYLLVSFNVATLPININWKQILGMGTMAGIGFTMSIFTTMLAYSNTDARDIARVAILQV